MLKPGVLLCAMSLAAATVLQAAPVIKAEKLNKSQFAQALKAASDDTAIEYHGQTKTKAQWRSYLQTTYKSVDAAQLQQLASGRKAKLDEAAKALRDEQDQDLAKQNAEVMKEFEELKSR